MGWKTHLLLLNKAWELDPSYDQTCYEKKAINRLYLDVYLIALRRVNWTYKNRSSNYNILQIFLGLW